MASPKVVESCGCCKWVVHVNASIVDYMFFAATQLQLDRKEDANTDDLAICLKTYLCDKCYKYFTAAIEIEEDTVQNVIMDYGVDATITFWATTTDEKDKGRLYPLDVGSYKSVQKDHPGFFKFHSLRHICHACGSHDHITFLCKEIHDHDDFLNGMKACKFCSSTEHPTFFCESENANVD
jgi:hypothetical protein